MLDQQAPPTVPLDLAEFTLDGLYDGQGVLVLAMDKRQLAEALEPQETRLVTLYQACLDRAGKAQTLDEALRWVAQARAHAEQREATDHHQECHESAAWQRVSEALAIGRRLIGQLDEYATALKRGVVQSLVRWVQ
jgi:hypothetical protein